MFVALTPPDEVSEHLAEFLEPRQEAGGPLRWSPPQRWHLTLAFLPSVADTKLDELSERLTETAAGRPPLDVRLEGAGAFPNPAAAKTLWAGVAGDLEPLGQLAAAVRAATVRAGLSVDGGKFRPHLTLARINRPLDVTRWLRVLDLYQGPSWQVGELSLIESQLGGGSRGRTRYLPREAFPVGK